MGVNKDTIRFWENSQAKPSLAKIPKIIEFLGNDPFEKETQALGDIILEYRRIYGLTQKKLAEQLGVDPTTLAGWEKGEHRPTRQPLDKLTSLFTSFPSFSSKDEK